MHFDQVIHWHLYYTWRPKLLALQWRIPSSTEFILITGKTGPNGSSHDILISGRTLSNKSGHMRFPSLLYSWQNVAPFFLASITNPSIKLAEDSVMTGVMSQLSSGGPTVNLATLSLIFFTSASPTDSMIKATFTAVHLWPLTYQKKKKINENFFMYKSVLVNKVMKSRKCGNIARNYKSAYLNDTRGIR